jgi:SAM-dependent methyltransferase
VTVPHTPYPDFANPELLEKIPSAARTILDVGCGQGALGAEYLRRNPNCRVLGMDPDALAIEHARTRLNDVFCGDIEQNPMPFAVPEGVDCIIYGDVLERLADPWALVAEQVKHLNDNGTVLVCMANVEHWSFAARLLAGQFDYTESGLLDRAHLRWFTPRTMAKLLAGAGLHLSDVMPRPTSMDSAEKFVRAMTPGLQAVGIDPNEYLNRAGPLQFIWRARKTPVPRLEVTATMLPPQGGVSDVRVVEPVRALTTDSSVFVQIQSEARLKPALADTPRIAILHRPLLLGESGISRLRALLQQDYIIISEFDDHPVFMEERGVNVSELLTFSGVHAVQTSTPVLEDILRKQNPEVRVFPNGIFELPPVHNFQDADHLTMFFGAINRGGDWAPLMPTLNEVARAVGPRLKFHVMFDEDFFNALETPHKTFSPMCDYATYIRELGACELCFMPLADNTFNRAKSDLKFIESGACRVAVLASNVVYAKTVKDGRNGIVFHDPMEMRAGLLRLLAYPEATRKMADAARAYVAGERMLAYQVQARIDWYRDLWARREELNAALKARVPELFAE